MTEYIRKEDVVKECGEWYVEEGTEEGFIGTVSQMLDMFSPANVAKIIRCENCQYHSYDEVFCCYWCEHEGMVREVKPDFYCGYGEE